MGSPYVKAVCMGRSLMILGMVGKNIGEWLKNGELPKSVSKYGNNASEIFVAYSELEDKFGAKMKDIPLGAVGIYTYCQRFKVGLQQLMAGSRNLTLNNIPEGPYGTNRRIIKNLRNTLARYVMEAYSEEANKILE